MLAWRLNEMGQLSQEMLEGGDTPDPVLEQIGEAYTAMQEYEATVPAEDGIESTRFIVRIFKELVTGNKQWVNTYELVSAALTAVSAVLPVLGALIQFERAIHYDFVQFDRATVSTWTPDSKPYNPLVFKTLALADVAGTRVTGGGLKEPLKVVMWADKAVPVGRNGRNFYRGALLESDVMSAGGDPDLEQAGYIDFFSGQRELYLTPFLQGGDAAVKLAMIGPDTIVRTLTSISPRGVTIASNNHKWFNRTGK